ncbi:hypothetical protein GN956_G19084 [Arapaima gigas]
MTVLLVWIQRRSLKTKDSADIMESGENVGLSAAAIVAIVCNSVVGVLILILFVILYKACQVPSHQEKPTTVAKGHEQQVTEHKYLLAKL